MDQTIFKVEENLMSLPKLLEVSPKRSTTNHVPRVVSHLITRNDLGGGVALENPERSIQPKMIIVHTWRSHEQNGGILLFPLGNQFGRKLVLGTDMIGQMSGVQKDDGFLSQALVVLQDSVDLCVINAPLEKTIKVKVSNVGAVNQNVPWTGDSLVCFEPLFEALESSPLTLG